VQEGVKSNRYELNSARRTNNIAYVFAQTEIKPVEKLTIIAGFRYDNNQLFAAAFSPKIAAMFKANDHLKFNASIGRGFKAPDFRQLYLNFTNTAAGGYSVFGALEAQKQIEFLQSIGQILSIESDYYKLKELHPEYARGINFGLQYNPNQQIQFDLSFFRNDVENLIDTRLVAYHKSGAQIFSYLNLKNAYTQGLETQLNVKLSPQIAVAAGYQYLLTADKDQIKDIKAGKIYTIDASGFARLMRLDEYIGLPNRSKHMANFKLTYENENFFTNLRIIYRSKWAVSDKDGNGLYNSNDGFANAFAQINIAAGKQINKQFRLQIGCDNVSNYIDIANLPNLAGRTFYTTLSYQFYQKNKK
jgi:outer membrane receptor for ferrienterochelin and colicins